MKPMIHAESSAKKFGGKPDDYLKIHNWFDQTKAHFPDQRHRAILHSSFGIFLCEQVFGEVITNSEGKKVSVRDIGEQHVIEDFRGKFIPTVQDWLSRMKHEPWMDNGEEPIKSVPPVMIPVPIELPYSPTPFYPPNPPFYPKPHIHDNFPSGPKIYD